MRLTRLLLPGVLALTLACAPGESRKAHRLAVGRDAAAQAPSRAGGGQARSARDVGGDALLLQATPASIPSQVLCRKAYVCSFNRETLLPNWVAWRLTAGHTDGPVSRKGYGFHPDVDVDAECRVTTYDYARSGYDRGHLCPAGDNRWDAEAMDQCFLMTNVCPQAHGLNAGDWNEMEAQCRNWAECYGEVYVVAGPILFKGRHRRIGRQHKVAVPEAFFKVVLCLEGEPKAIGFVYRNRDGNRPKGDYVNSVDEVERITGIDFFPSLDDRVEQSVEAAASLDDW